MTESTLRLRAVFLVRELVRWPDALFQLALGSTTLLNALSTMRFGQAAIHPPCLITLVTGYRCPGCGLTRALTPLWLGHFHEAV